MSLIPIQYQAKLYCLLHDLNIAARWRSRLKKSISERLRRAGFRFEDKHAGQVVRSIAYISSEELEE